MRVSLQPHKETAARKNVHGLCNGVFEADAADAGPPAVSRVTNTRVKPEDDDCGISVVVRWIPAGRRDDIEWVGPSLPSAGVVEHALEGAVAALGGAFLGLVV